MNRYKYLAAFLYLSVRMTNFMRWRTPIQDVVVRRWLAIREPDARRDIVHAHPARQAALARETLRQRGWHDQGVLR